MPFLGKQPTAGFASIVKDDLTADGSTTAFTLSKQVANANDIAVFVGNVRQEPTDAYTVSGTTLTMSAAPASGINFYVLHIAGTVESSVIPADGTISGAKLSDNFNYDSGTLYLDSTNNRVGIGTTTPTQATLHVAGGSVPARFESTSDTTTYVQFGASATTNYGQIAMTGNDMTLRTSYTDRMKIDSNGYVTKPNQVSFFAGWATTSSPPSGYGAVNYATGFSRVGWNIGSGWNSAGTFTAPVTGKYFMFMSMGFTSGAYNMHLGFYINGGGGTTAQGNSNGDPWQQTGRGNDGSSDQDHITVSRIFNLNANDTLKPVYLIFDNDNNSQIYQNRSFVGGYLLG